jgi:hypothetical protein
VLPERTLILAHFPPTLPRSSPPPTELCSSEKTFPFQLDSCRIRFAPHPATESPSLPNPRISTQTPGRNTA